MTKDNLYARKPRASFKAIQKKQQELFAKEQQAKFSAIRTQKAIDKYRKEPQGQHAQTGYHSQIFAPAPVAKIILDCPICGAAVYSEKWNEHEEWHETMVEAIKEQVEEAMAQQQRKRAVETFEIETVLGFCEHGYNLDNTFCPKGCRV